MAYWLIMDFRGRDTKQEALELIQSQELVYAERAQRKLNQKVNKILRLPRRTGHEWSLFKKFDDGEPLSWKEFYDGDHRQIAVTTAENLVIGGEIFYAGAGGPYPALPHHLVTLRLLQRPPTAEDAARSGYSESAVFQGPIFYSFEQLGKAILKLQGGQ